MNTAAISCIHDMVICPYTNVCVFADSFCDGDNDCGDAADEDANICGQLLYLCIIVIIAVVFVVIVIII